MQDWPELPYSQWNETKDTLHMWTQIVGKTALSHSPRVNHWWNCGLEVTERGLSTGVLYEDKLPFRVELDFTQHELHVFAKRQAARTIPLESMTVAEFYRRFTAALRELAIAPQIWPVPVEIAGGIPFTEDTQHNVYDPAAVERLHQVLLSVERVLDRFRARFCGKCSPVLFWWGTFDICVTQFSGRPAPPREDADSILREAMSHEEMSFGWWPGDDSFPEPAFYAYAAPEPGGLAAAGLPAGAYYSAEKQEFFLPYANVRSADDPDALLLEFLQAVYDSGAKLGNWDAGLVRS
jgi:hypothetical protein